jgi:hypothetical protein
MCVTKQKKQKKTKLKFKSKIKPEFELRFFICNQVILGIKNSLATPTKTKAQRNKNK